MFEKSRRNTVAYASPEMSGWEDSWRACYRDYFTGYLWERSHSQHSVDGYSQTLTRFFNEVERPPQAITRRDVEAFANQSLLVGPVSAKYESGTPPSARTRNNKLAIISSFYKYACGYEVLCGGKMTPLCDRNPALGCRFSKLSPRHRTMTIDEFKRFLAAIPQDGQAIHARDRALFITLFWTARRRAEICALTWGDIEETTFIVNPKTHETRAGYRYTFKNKGGGIFSAELPAPAMEAIQAYIRIAGRHMEPDSPVFAAHGPAHGGFVHDPFTGVSGHLVFLRMKHYLQLAGMDEKAYSPHSIRHAASLARYRAGSGILEIAHVLNHRNVSTTQIYVQELDTSQDTGAQLLVEKYGVW